MDESLKTNVLYYGDNLEILRKYIPNNSIDLIYLDPPFSSNKDYNIIFKEDTGERSEAVDAGYYHSPIWDKDYPKIQILTVEELLQGKTVEMPPQTQTNVTFAKAPKVTKKEGEQLSME